MYIFLTLSILMVSVNIDLLLQMKQSQSNLIQNSFRSEKTVLITVLLFFELSYIVRTVFDMTGLRILYEKGAFGYYVFADLAYILEAASFLTLLLFHSKNFR